MDEKEARLQLAFECVRKAFFPRWDKDRKWIVVRDPGLPNPARVDRATHSIRVAGIPEDEDELLYLLVHEICHPAASDYHGKKFQSRLREVAHEARKQGLTRLAERVEKELAEYNERPELANAADVYGQIRDWVLDVMQPDGPSASYDQLADSLSRDLGMHRHEFDNKYRRARAVYGEAVKDAMKRYRARERFKQLLDER